MLIVPRIRIFSIFVFLFSQEQGLVVLTNGDDNFHNSLEEDQENESSNVDYKKKLSNRILISAPAAELLLNLGEGSLGWLWSSQSTACLLLCNINTYHNGNLTLLHHCCCLSLVLDRIVKNFPKKKSCGKVSQLSSPGKEL